MHARSSWLPGELLSLCTELRFTGLLHSWPAEGGLSARGFRQLVPSAIVAVRGVSMKRQAVGSGMFSPAVVDREDRADWSVVLRSGYPLAAYPASVVDVFAARAREHPERILVAQRDGDGWRSVSWGEAAAQVEALARGLHERGAAGRPIMILSGNSVEHLLLTLAAFTAGSPAVPVSVAY